MVKETKHMLDSQIYAIRIEQIIRDAFECDRFAIGGLVNSDYIGKYPFTAMISTVMYLCERNDSDINVALNFFEKYSYYGQWNIDELLSCENGTLEIDGCNYELGYINGEEAMNAIVDDFTKVCTQLK